MGQLEDIGWLAGIFDGEGCYSIRVMKGITKYYGLRPRFQPQFTITNTDTKIIDKVSMILSNFNIKYRKFTREKFGNNKPQYCIELYATGLRTILPIIRNHSAKIDQIDILLRALELTKKNSSNNGNKGGWGRSPTSLDTLQEFDNLRMQLVNLHGRQSKSLLTIKSSDYKISDADNTKAKELQTDFRLNIIETHKLEAQKKLKENKNVEIQAS